MGDFNASVGEGEEGKEVGKYGLGIRNERGQKLVEFCKRQKLMVTNTWFQHEKRRRYTWKKPGDTGRYQIDYLLVNQRYRGSVKNARSYPGADVDSDHNLIGMKIRIKLKRIRKRKVTKKWDLDKFAKDTTVKRNFQQFVEEQMTKNRVRGDTIEKRWSQLKDTVKEGIRNSIPKRQKVAKKPWVTKEMLEKMEQRRKWKNQNTEEARKMYKKLNNELRREIEAARDKSWNEECAEIEEFEKIGRSDLMYYKINQHGKKYAGKKEQLCLKDGDGKLLTMQEDIKNRWQEYTQELYAAEGRPLEEEMKVEEECEIEEDNKGPDLMEEEILLAIKEMAEKKAAGEDEIPAEIWKQLGQSALNELIDI